MSFLTDLPSKNSFVELGYTKTDVSRNHIFQKRIVHNTFMANNLYSSTNSNYRLSNSQSSLKKQPFLSRTVRFKKLFDDKTAFPGPGSYQVIQSALTTNNSSISTKGYGNGFVSKEQRFKNLMYENEKYKPGPGEYKSERYTDMMHSIDTSLQGQSLFNSKVNKSIGQSQNTPGPWAYDPIKVQEQFDPLHGTSFHKSKTIRFTHKNNGMPGPGTYTHDIEWDYITKNQQISFFFKSPKKEEPNFLQKFNIKTDFTKDEMAIQLNKKKGHLQKMPLINKTKEITTKNNEILGIGITAKKKDEFEYEYVYESEKKDLFMLAPPRWRKNKQQLKIPGPAYYFPKLKQGKLSFNHNTNNFLCSPGVLFSST